MCGGFCLFKDGVSFFLNTIIKILTKYNNNNKVIINIYIYVLLITIFNNNI